MMPTPIPADVGDALGEALVLLVQWQGGADEPVAVLDGKTMPISMIFELVAGRAFRDEVPRSMLQLLQTYAARDPERKKEIAVLALRPTFFRLSLIVAPPTRGAFSLHPQSAPDFTAAFSETSGRLSC
jgi:hypothetical protein